MPYTVKKNFGKCKGTAKPYAVVKEDDDSIMGCHASREAAGRQIGAIEANEAMPGKAMAYKIAGIIEPEALDLKAHITEYSTKSTKIPHYHELPDTFVLDVMGVPFGGHASGRDRDGEAFSPQTETGLKLNNDMPLTYWHGFGPDSLKTIQQPIQWVGAGYYMGETEKGHAFMARLDHTNPLAQRLMQNPDNLKASSGAVKHLIRHDPNNRGMITSWIVGELAIFDTNDIRMPANDLATVDVMRGRPVRAYRAYIEAERLRARLLTYKP